MSDALQHALIGALVALAALLEARRRRELEREVTQRQERLLAAARARENDQDRDTRRPPQG